LEARVRRSPDSPTEMSTRQHQQRTIRRRCERPPMRRVRGRGERTDDELLNAKLLHRVDGGGLVGLKDQQEYHQIPHESMSNLVNPVPATHLSLAYTAPPDVLWRIPIILSTSSDRLPISSRLHPPHSLLLPKSPGRRIDRPSIRTILTDLSHSQRWSQHCQRSMYSLTYAF
jgi:hypothetical protein